MRWILALLLVSSLFGEEKPVICITIPKSGTHLLKKAIKLITGTNPPWLKSRVNSETRNRIFLAHLFPKAEETLAMVPLDQCTKILLIRDPRDVLVSFLNHLKKKKPWPFGKVPNRAVFDKLPWDEQMGELLNSSYLSPKTSLYLAMDWIHEPGILVIRFEDLVGSKGGGSDEAQRMTLYALANAIGHPLSWEKIDQVAQQLFGGTFTFHEGKIGKWKTSYSEYNKALFKSLLGKEMRALGYSDLDW